MKVKGRAIKSFNGNVQVENYPMKGRSDEELEELDTCLERRKVEEIEGEIRKNLLPDDLGAHLPLVGKSPILFSLQYDCTKHTSPLLSSNPILLKLFLVHAQPMLAYILFVAF